jgi:probable LLM family oxidoreductase
LSTPLTPLWYSGVPRTTPCAPPHVRAQPADALREAVVLLALGERQRVVAQVDQARLGAELARALEGADDRHPREAALTQRAGDAHHPDPRAGRVLHSGDCTRALDSLSGQDYSQRINYLIDSKGAAVAEQAVKIQESTNPSAVAGTRGAMQIGVDSFAAAFDENSRAVSPSQRLRDLVEQIEHADRVGLDVFGIGEHHRREFLDSAPAVILGAAAARTKRIRLTSAVTVLSAADPVRVFQQFATLDLLSQGRAEMVVGRGSFVEAFPLFGLKLEEYDSLFASKLDLLLKIRDDELVHWSGEHRPPLTGQGVYPRPVQNPLPIWLGVGGTPGSFVRAGTLGLPLMVAIIGGEPRRFRPLVDLYRDAWRRAGHPPEGMKVGVHALGYVAETTEQAVEEFFPGYQRAFTEVGKERGWGPVTRADFDAQRTPHGALIVGSPEEAIEKIGMYDEALGGISRLTFMMNTATVPHAKLMAAIETLGDRIAPVVRKELA